MAGDRRMTEVRAALQTIEKSFGKGAVMRLGDRPQTAVEVIPTGSPRLDIALGSGGLPRGRVVEVFGPESSGKTTLALHALAEAQRRGGLCAFIDAEHALDPTYAANLGVQVADLLIAQPDTGEQALEITDILTRSGGIDLLVIDSVAALIPKAELDGDMGDSHMGLQARLMSQALRKLTGAVSRTGTLVMFINQVRQKIGVTFGNGEVTTGGNALKFYSSVRLEIRRIGAIKRKEQMVGARTRIKVVKNKLAPPFRQAEVDIYYGTGISAVADLLEMGLLTGRLNKRGNHFYVGDERFGHGREDALEALGARPDICESIYRQALEDAGISARPDPEGAVGGAEACADGEVASAKPAKAASGARRGRGTPPRPGNGNTRPSRPPAAAGAPAEASA